MLLKPSDQGVLAVLGDVTEKDVADGDLLDEPGAVAGGDSAAFPRPAGEKSGECHDLRVEDHRERQVRSGGFPGAVGEDAACSIEQIARVSALMQPGEVHFSRFRIGVANPAASVTRHQVSVVSLGS
ncbi:hypothetical protein [Streptomyces monashensis]|uniref:Uncharacterized protein n=1 Tax=Streptomyces monashensis TaxID=1678012 RepID=A0A1S2QKX8_9ACTN|nr:hypothetical protein [Streptomyces monashensis]OIK06035.1 hypothetical protein BIV23_10120 [Streptomyces monashensis]